MTHKLQTIPIKKLARPCMLLYDRQVSFYLRLVNPRDREKADGGVALNRET